VRRLNAGFSLIELMVAVTLGLILMVALISVFVGSRSAYQATSGVASLADEGRFAVNTISQLARGAGFIGCSRASTSATGSSLLNWSSAPVAYDFRYAVGGYEAAGTAPGDTVTMPATPTAGAGAGNWAPNLDAAVTGATSEQAQSLFTRQPMRQGAPAVSRCRARALCRPVSSP